jgi:hypothetical protein
MNYRAPEMHLMRVLGYCLIVSVSPMFFSKKKTVARDSCDGTSLAFASVLLSLVRNHI